MLDRLKFAFGFFRAYRKALKSGVASEEARAIAARETIDDRLGGEAPPATPLDLPPEVAEIWRDPEAVFAEDADEGAWFGSGLFEISPAHLALLRRMRFWWDGAERGAPMLDPARPYGQADLMTQLADSFPGEDAASLARRHVEMMYVLARVLAHGTLQPGAYALRNITADDVRSAMQGYGGETGLSDDDLGLDASGRIIVDDERLALLRHVSTRWPSKWECEERLEVGECPAAAIDPKRPYGDFTFIEVDMARILGRLPPAPPDGVFEPEPELAAHLQRLHWQMLGAIQAFVENAEIAPGAYDLA